MYEGVIAGAIWKGEAVTVTEDAVSLHMTLAPSPRPGPEAHSREEAPALTLRTACSQSFCRDLREQREARGGSMRRGRGKPRGYIHSSSGLWGPRMLEAGHKDMGSKRDPECQAVGKMATLPGPCGQWSCALAPREAADGQQLPGGTGHG